MTLNTGLQAGPIHAGDLFSLRIDDGSGTYVEITRDTTTAESLFTTTFTPMESLTGGSLKQKARLYNTGFTYSSHSYVVLKFDLSESFTKNFDKDVAFDDIGGNFNKSFNVKVWLGLPDQEVLSYSYKISSDRISENSDKQVGIIITENPDLINAYSTATSVSNKLGLFPKFPPVGGYIPIEIEISLDPQYVTYLSQKPVSTKYPNTYSQFIKNIANLQALTYSSTATVGLTQNENLKAIYNQNLGTLMDNTFYTVSGTTVTADFFIHSLNYVAEHSYKGTDAYKLARHIFEIAPSIGPSLPSEINFNSSGGESVFSPSTITYTTGTAKEVYKIMTEILGYAKFVHYNVILAGATNTATYITALENQLNSLHSDMCNMKTMFDYTTYSGSTASDVQKFFVGAFLAIMYRYVDVVRYQVLGDTSRAHLADYQDLWQNIDCYNTYNTTGLSYCIPLLSMFNGDDLIADIEYPAFFMLLYDFERFVTLSDVNQTFVGNKYYGRFQDDIYSIGYEMLRILPDIEVFNSSAFTDGTELSIAPEKLPYYAMTLAGASQISGEEGTTRHQAWHYINKYFRLRGVPTDSLIIPTKSDHTSINLANGGTQGDVLTILGDIDIIASSLYAVIDAFYTKQESTTISLKMDVTTT